MKSILTLILFLMAMSRPVPVTPSTDTQGETPSVIRLKASGQLSAPREAILRVARTEIGTREATGNNDGPVEKYLVAAGAKKGDPYCAAFVYWVGREALGKANPFPRSAWSPDFVAHAQWKKGVGPELRPADTFGIYFASKKRVAHTGLIWKVGANSVTTIEANSTFTTNVSGEADREGTEGVGSKIRLKSSLYQSQSWTE